jgi:hypothetical protein
VYCVITLVSSESVQGLLDELLDEDAILDDDEPLYDGRTVSGHITLLISRMSPLFFPMSRAVPSTAGACWHIDSRSACGRHQLFMSAELRQLHRPSVFDKWTVDIGKLRVLLP